MTNEEAIADIRDNIKPVVGGKSLDIAIQSLTAISELSKSLKAVNRYDWNEKVLIGFNMAVAIFNNYFGEESCALKNEQTDGDLINRFRDYQIEWLTSHNDIDLKEIETWVIQFLKDTEECFLKTELPSAEQTDFEWCKGCKEYDTEKHCCHRYSSFIRESLQENINAVLEDIKTELHENAEKHSDGDYYLRDEWIDEIIDKHISGKEE